MPQPVRATSGGGSGGPLASSFPILADTPIATDATGLEYGIDVSTFPDLDPQFRLISGRRAIVEVVMRRFSTPHGALLDDPDFGRNVREMLNEGLTPSVLYQWQHALQVEALKDERVLSAEVVFDTTRLISRGVLVISVALTDADGPFRFVLAVDQMTVELLREAA